VCEPPGEIQRLRQELEAALEASQRQKAGLEQKLLHLENDYHVSIQKEKQIHDDDLLRISQDRVSQYLKIG